MPDIIFYCPECGNSLSVDDSGQGLLVNCPMCSKRITVPSKVSPPPFSQPRNQKRDNEKYCSECGQIILAKAEICPKCGVRQISTNPFVSASGGRKKLTAGLLGIFLGGLGIHKFYLGENGLGVVYIIFCWTYIPAIVGLIEGIVYLTLSEDDFNRKYNQQNPKK